MNLNVALIGPGQVGKEFLYQLSAFSHPKLTLSLVGLMNSKRMILSQSKLPWNQELSDANPTADFGLFCDHVKSLLPCVVVDCTSSSEIPKLYPSLLEKVHLITANKKGYSDSLELYQSIVQSSLKSNTFHYHESTVGAGLPIISTLNDMVMTGDEIVKIEGIFSGTLSYIFNNFSQLTSSSLKFSDIVSEAKRLGYTEPDPRDDLNGMDVARKVTILGRVSGLNTTLESLSVENIVPTELRSIKSADEFMQKLSDFDGYFEELNRKAAQEKCVLRCVGIVDPKGKSRVTLEKYPYSHPFASLKGSDNVIAFTTKRFPNPLIIQGAGAGTAVTAFGLFSDLLKIAKNISGSL